MNKISIKDVEPIEHLDIPIPDGGFVVLRGTHGTGKTTALRAIESLVTGEGSLAKRDGCLEGRVEGFGAAISIKKVMRRTGGSHFAVDKLAGRFDISDLVDPHIKDPVSADAYRIKELVKLAGVKPDPTLFHKLLGGATEFESIVGEQEADDLVALAKRIKAAIEKAAREQESAADKANGAAEAHRKAAGDNASHVGTERDLSALNADLEESIREEAKLKADAESGAALKKRAAEAMERLEDAKTAYEGLSVEAAEKALADACKADFDASELMRQAQEAVRNAKILHDKADSDLREAKRQQANMEGWQKSIDEAASITVPSPEELDSAAKDVERCREQIEKAIARRAALEHVSKAEQEESAAKASATKAERYRKAAAEVDTVLSEAVGMLNCPLRVKKERLVLTTDRGEEYFAELSDGERCALIVEIAIPLVPDDIPLILSQAAFGELSPSKRKEINRTLKERGVVCLTASVTDEEKLTATLFDDE